MTMIDAVLNEWLAVRRFDWTLGHGMGMVAEK